MKYLAERNWESLPHFRDWCVRERGASEANARLLH